jgi:hypothetical protein
MSVMMKRELYELCWNICSKDVMEVICLVYNDENVKDWINFIKIDVLMTLWKLCLML